MELFLHSFETLIKFQFPNREIHKILCRQITEKKLKIKKKIISYKLFLFLNLKSLLT